MMIMITHSETYYAYLKVNWQNHQQEKKNQSTKLHLERCDDMSRKVIKLFANLYRRMGQIILRTLAKQCLFLLNGYSANKIYK